MGSMIEKLKEHKYKLFVIYFIAYLCAFYVLEHNQPEKIHILHFALDQYIPFVEFFIVPYLLWFIYIFVGAVYFYFYERDSFCKLVYLGMIGMTVFILVSIVYPNGLEIRPEVFARDNIFVRLTQFLYSMDTPTNVLPSIHVYNSVAMFCVINRSNRLKNNKKIKSGAGLLTFLIILSTIFLKQHSIFDVVSAIALFCVALEFVYNHRIEKIQMTMEEMRYRKKYKLKEDYHN